jgi:general secretion pathway protein A
VRRLHRQAQFRADAFEGIYKASGGIPRRINSVCDRLLLLGFPEASTHLTPSRRR